tara:strand:+ start:3156 stop:3431 length:276 start_codon:yes stop_codon:yes gene_type:complete
MSMSNAERDFYLRIIDDQPGVMPVAYEISKYKHSLDIQVWLIKNKITGKILLSWLNEKFDHSIMSMIKYIIKRVNKDKEIKPIYAHKDYRV